jgi:hypothetical protein
MLDHIGRRLAFEGLRYLASTQLFGMVVLHAGWMLLAAAMWGHGAAEGEGVALVTRPLLRAFAALGGVDAQGHGDENSIFQVWLVLSLPVYLLLSLWRWLRPDRKPWGFWRRVLVSTGVAAAGYTFAFLGDARNQDVAVAIIGFTVATGLASVWGLGVQHLVELVMQPKPGRAARRPVV